jgi:hypothetical protein
LLDAGMIGSAPSSRALRYHALWRSDRKAEQICRDDIGQASADHLAEEKMPMGF